MLLWISYMTLHSLLDTIEGQDSRFKAHHCFYLLAGQRNNYCQPSHFCWVGHLQDGEHLDMAKFCLLELARRAYPQSCSLKFHLEMFASKQTLVHACKSKPSLLTPTTAKKRKRPKVVHKAARAQGQDSFSKHLRADNRPPEVVFPVHKSHAEPGLQRWTRTLKIMSWLSIPLKLTPDILHAECTSCEGEY